MSLKTYLDQLWILGRYSPTYLRFYPNPGFQIVWRTTAIKWSRFDGWSVKRS